MMPLFDCLSAAIGTEEEDDEMERIYGRMPSRNFSSDLLARATEQAAVIELSGVFWNDWGKPERIVDSLRRIGRAPVFSFKHLSDSPAQEQAKRTYSRRNVDASMKTDRILCLLFTCHDRDVPCKIAS